MRAGAALTALLMFASASSARAEFHGKGSWVGRILSESVAEADESANAAVSEDESEREQESARDALNKLMKHPTYPDYDPLRPMSGRWVRCRANGPGALDSAKGQEAPKTADVSVPASAKSAPFVLDRFSSSDRAHFTHTVINAVDSACKNVLDSERSTYECSSADKRTLECKLTKRETKSGSGAWIDTKVSSGAEKPLRLSFKGVEPRKKKRAAATKPRDPRKLELTFGGETYALDFEPAAAAAKPAPGAPAAAPATATAK